MAGQGDSNRQLGDRRLMQPAMLTKELDRMSDRSQMPVVDKRIRQLGVECEAWSTAMGENAAFGQ